MKYFLDTANIEEIQETLALPDATLHGVTTNPTLLLRAGYTRRQLPKAYKKICALVPGPVSLEVFANESTRANEMVRQGKRLAKIAKNAVVKIPAILEGFKAIGTLAKEGIIINTTLIFRVEQALEAARQGSTYVSPFVGRFDDAGQKGYGIQLVRDIREAFYGNAYDDRTFILAASIRNLPQIHVVAEAGADYVTLPPLVFTEVMALRAQHRKPPQPYPDKDLKSPLTDQGLARFNEDHGGLG